MDAYKRWQPKTIGGKLGWGNTLVRGRGDANTTESKTQKSVCLYLQHSKNLRPRVRYHSREIVYEIVPWPAVI